MPAPYPAGVRLLPNAVTVVALCAGLSAVYFALDQRFEESVLAVGVAALCDALDGRLARLLDASTRIGAELDSLADLVSFGVSPALVLYVWQLDENGRFGWVVALVFAVCMALRLARFNTLLDAEDPYPFAKEFFVGVPAPAAALVAGIPLFITLHLGPGWWSTPALVGIWALFAAALMVSRLPTLSFKTVRVSQRAIGPLLVLVGLLTAVLVTVPYLTLAVVGGVYLGALPYTMYRYRWLSLHPEAWDVQPGRERRAVVRAARSARRLGLRPPLRRRVAGRASAVGARARAVAGAVRRRAEDPPPGGPGPAQPRNRLRLGLRRDRPR